MDDAKLGEFMGRVEAKLDGIGEKLDAGATKMAALDARTRRLEVRVGTLWVIGPLMVTAAAFARDIGDFFGSRH
jgi:hypothetical protein